MSGEPSNLSKIVLLYLLFALSYGMETTTQRVLHKMERHIPRDSFVKMAKSLATDDHELVFAVQQRNLDVMESKLMESSTPGSPKYLQWMTYEQVGDLTSNPEGANAITAWLESNGCEVVKTTKHKDYITAVASIGVWESLLDTEFFEWEDGTFIHRRNRYTAEGNRKVHRALEYSIPEELRPHLFGVFNTVQTPPPYQHAYHVANEGARRRKNLRGRRKLAGSTAVTVAQLNTFYKIGTNIASADLSQSVFETNEVYFSQNDLNSFQRRYDLTEQTANEDYGFETSDCVNNDCVEGNLDIQYIMGIAQETESIYWYVDNLVVDPFVTWITAVSNDPDPPTSNSVSWGAVEAYESTTYMTAFNTEAIKLSAQGVTIVVSSGDSGAPNSFSTTCLCSGVTANSATSNGYNPSFPATSPYVTAVGGTMGPESGDDEVVCDADEGGVITSGGGFSSFFTAPSWQTDAIADYFSAVSAPVAGYATSGRGYPDISFIAVNYQVVIAGGLSTVFGTSASAPVFAGMVSLINARRLEEGLSTVGFMNPTLYANGMNASTLYKFNDVTSGNNKCCAQSTGTTCCSTGFVAASGWDPTTGWGSMNFDTLSDMYGVYTPYSAKKSVLTHTQIILIAVLGGLALLLCLCCTCYLCQTCWGSQRTTTRTKTVYVVESG